MIKSKLIGKKIIRITDFNDFAELKANTQNSVVQSQPPLVKIF